MFSQQLTLKVKVELNALLTEPATDEGVSANSWRTMAYVAYHHRTGRTPTNAAP